MSQAAAAANVANVIIQDYLDRGPESAYCQYLEFIDEGPGGWNPAIGFARNRFCNPPPPPPPPATDFFDAGGVPCRLYQVTFATGSPGSALTNTVVNRRGPIGLISETYTATSGAPGKKYILTSGNNTECTRVAEVIAGSDNVNVTDVIARIVSIVPLEGTPETEIPVWRPPLQPPNEQPQPFEVNIEINVDGVEVNAPISFGPVIETDFGPTIQINFEPTANFNPPVDIDINVNPTFGLDVDLEFILPLGGTPAEPRPVPGQEPVSLPPVQPNAPSECETFDYERIEYAIENAKCCKSTTSTEQVGFYEFEEEGTVRNVNLPSGTIGVYIEVGTGPNTRIFKLSAGGSEAGHGNASITYNGHVRTFERIYVSKHFLPVDFERENKGLRLSLQKGSTALVTALIHTPPPPPTDGENL